jgi:hypothetical protein
LDVSALIRDGHGPSRRGQTKSSPRSAGPWGFLKTKDSRILGPLGRIAGGSHSDESVTNAPFADQLATEGCGMGPYMRRDLFKVKPRLWNAQPSLLNRMAFDQLIPRTRSSCLPNIFNSSWGQSSIRAKISRLPVQRRVEPAFLGRLVHLHGRDPVDQPQHSIGEGEGPDG